MRFASLKSSNALRPWTEARNCRPILSNARHFILNPDSPDRTCAALLSLLLQAQATSTVSGSFD